MDPDKILEFIDALGERLGPAGEHVWQITVQQVYISSVVWFFAFTILSIILVSVGLWGIRYARAYKPKEPKDSIYYSSDDNFTRDVGYVGGGGALVLALVITIPATLYQVIMMLNAEYYAMIRLLENIIPQ